ncbi:uncharacterized protein LOC126820322 [Patella vulgata]|uniref:uncharacterized protein LOC126820322 n=1 Tax=Patella vulgata TaxID=6465 RepID=UPI00217F9EE2|nr:uncharacterized protein LOC126820322 [Patella vulgata]
MDIETSVESTGKGAASISCRLINFEEWQTIFLMKRDNQIDIHQILLTFDRQRKVIWFNKHLESRSLTKVKISRYDVTFQLWIYGLQCSDKGLFACRASSGSRNLEAERFLEVSAKPEPPEMLLPLTLVNGSSKRNNITCSADVGFPPGNLILSKRLPYESLFHDIVFDHLTKVTEKDQCTTTVKGEYFVSGEDSLNGTLIKCEVRNASGIPSVSVNDTLYVLKKSECKERKGGYIPHPNDCRYFIQCAISDIYISRCSRGLCFNPSTEKCDLLEPKTTHSAESIHPCRSNRHGDYFPHPVLCNKYFWCVQGKEVIQHCRLGTLYHRNGQCTFNIAESFCYNKTQTE